MGGFAAAFDERIASLLRSRRARSRTGVGAPLRIEDPGQIVHEMRLRKEPRELQAMRKAVELTRRTHLAAMKVGRPRAHEYELQAALERAFRGGGGRGWGGSTTSGACERDSGDAHQPRTAAPPAA